MEEMMKDEVNEQEAVSKEEFDSMKKQLEEYKKAYEKAHTALNNAIRAYNLLFNEYIYGERE